MSSLPPEPPPPSPGAAGLPWEERDRRGFFPSLLDTMGLFVSRPAEAWARTRLTGDLGSPLLFGVLVSWFSLALHRVLIAAIAMPILPGFLGRRFGMMAPLAGVGIITHIILLPFVIAIGLFLVTAILHFCCLIVGALTGTPSGFEGSFRVVAYAQVANLAAVIPIVGHFIAFVWWVVLAVMGIQRLHQTTQGKAIAAVLIPIVVCCGSLLFLGMLVGAAFLTRMAH
ncbi:MAG TPA: YIP1 family protein [Thermoanaerobaculia bacterium]|nr:YIP1 family protein [Thermoanaerobaculia bacterium]